VNARMNTLKAKVEQSYLDFNGRFTSTEPTGFNVGVKKGSTFR